MTIREYLLGIPSSRPACLSETEKIRFSDLVETSLRLPDTVTRPRIALRFKKTELAIRALSALDGRVQALMLLPSSLDSVTSATLVERAQCDWVISDMDLGQALGKVPILHWDELSGSPFVPATPMRTDWILCTSGTTAEPKLVRYCLESLIQTTKLDPARSADVRWGLLYDYARFAGLQVLLQSLLSGATLLSPEFNSSHAEQVRFLSQQACTHLGGTPTLWRKLLMTPEFDQLRLRHATLGGEIADDRLLKILRERMPETGIRHIYASTEAGVGFSVNDGYAGFPADYLNSSQQGAQLKISEGRLFIRRTGEQASYLNQDTNIQEPDGFIDTGDLVEVSGDRVNFLGRASGVINVGGNKVHPEVIEQVLLDHKDISMARVYARDSPITGSLVMADVVAAEGVEDYTALKQSVESHCQAFLQRYQRPVAIHVVNGIAITEAGKMRRY